MQRGFYFDQSRCTGCYACTIACKDDHDIPAGPAKWLRLSYREEGEFPRLFVSYVVSPCYQCAEPLCAYVCPNEAICKREEDGIVVVDRDKCRGEITCGIIDEKSMGPDFLYGEGQSPCQIACPAHVQVPAYVNLAAKGRFKEALDIVRQHMPLPSICGKVCMHPCETVCKRQDLDDPIAIMAIKGFLADNVEQSIPSPIPRIYDKSVAIVGSGPAGLASANDLIRKGYGVTIFEAMTVAGGMLVAGVPAHRLPRYATERDINYLRALGIEIRTSSPVNLKDGIAHLLADGFSAVLLALGAHKGQKLDLPGANLNGVLTGTDFMRAVNMGEDAPVGNSIAVVGGGNVAIDCARSAIRLGAKEAHVICLESRDKIPADKDEVKQAIQEGVILHTSSTTTKINRQHSHVDGIRMQRISNLVFSEDGKISFSKQSGTGETLKVSTVIFAIGQSPDLTGLSTEADIKIKTSGSISADPQTMMTGRKGVFAAGDCSNGATSIVEAIASGQRAAFFIDRYLQEENLPVRTKSVIDPATIKVNIPPDKQKQRRESMSLLSVKDRSSNFKEVAKGYSQAAVIAEAKRCLNCAGHLCKDVCPYSAPQFAIEEKAKMQKCDLCLERWAQGKKPICVEGCLPRALDAGTIDELREKYGNNTGAHDFVYSLVTKPSVIHKKKGQPVGLIK